MPFGRPRPSLRFPKGSRERARNESDGTPTGTAGGPSASPRALADIFSGFAKIGLLSFGGPAAQIAVMHRVLVEENNWLSERQFLNALNFCMLLPGPEAMQLTTYAGWRLRGVPGGLMAGLLFVVPGAAVMLALAAIYGFFGAVPLVSALFLGIKAAVLVVVIEALLKVARRALTAAVYWLIAGLAFVAIFFFAVPFPLVVLAAAAYGFLRGGDTRSRRPPRRRSRHSAPCARWFSGALSGGCR